MTFTAVDGQKHAYTMCAFALHINYLQMATASSPYLVRRSLLTSAIVFGFYTCHSRRVRLANSKNSKNSTESRRLRLCCSHSVIEPASCPLLGRCAALTNMCAICRPPRARLRTPLHVCLFTYGSSVTQSIRLSLPNQIAQRLQPNVRSPVQRWQHGV